VRDAGGVADVEIEELAEDHLVQLAVLGENERVVHARDEQDVVYPEPREIRQSRQTHEPTITPLLRLTLDRPNDQD